MVFSSFFGFLGSKFNLFLPFILFPFLLLSLGVSGQDQERFNHLTSDNGLTSNNARCLLKDSQGFLWIGTDAGLNRFDGITVTPYTHVIGDSTSLVNNFINTLYEDSLQRIWIGTGGGLSILEPESDKFINFRKVIFPGYTIDFKIGIRTIRKFKNKIWIATENAVVTCPLDSFSFTQVNDNFKSQDDIPIYFLTNQAIVTSTAIWFLSSKGPYYTEDGKTFIHRYNKLDHLPIFKYPWYASIYADGDSILYFTTFHYDGIYTYRPATQSLDSIPFTHAPKAKDIWIRSLYRLNPDELMGTSEHSGVFTFNTKTGNSKFFVPDPTNPNSLGSYHGDQILIDEGVIFLATDLGLEYKNSLQLPFKVFNTLKTGIGNMKVCIAEDDAGNFWIGTLKQGLFCYTPATGKFIPFPLPGHYNNIWSLYYENNELLLGTRGGLATFSTTSKKFKSLKQEVPKVVQELTDGPTTSILKDNSGSFWIALFPYGLLKYNFTSKKYIHFTAVDSIYHLPGKGTISAATMDNNGTLWLGLNDGTVSYINTRDNSIRNLNNLPIGENEIIGKITSIKPDHKGNLWIGTTQSGLFEYNIATSNFKSFDTRQKLSSNSLSSIVFDQDGSLWINTTNGINKYNPISNKFILYNKSDGLPVDQYSHDASVNIAPIFLAKNGMIYTCSDSYLVSFEPRALETNPNFPKLIFPSYSFSGNSYTITSADKELHFTHKDKNITFEFFGINFIDASKTQFAYILEGYDEDWIDCGSIPSATYTDLPIGKHLLKIKTTNKSDKWNDQEASIMIHVSGPFWDKGKLIALSLIICALIFFVIYKIRLYQYNKIQSIRQKISRDLHDNIGSTLSSISISSLVAEKMDPGLKPELVPVIQSIGQSARTAIDNMNDIVWAISPANETFQDIMDRLQIFATSILAGRNISLQMDIPESLQHVKLDMQQRKNVYLLLREAINNVAKYSKAQNCKIAGKLNHNLISVQVVDDGIGMEEGKQSLGGNGLVNMRQRAEELNGQFQIHSQGLKGTQIDLQFNVN